MNSRKTRLISSTMLRAGAPLLVLALAAAASGASAQTQPAAPTQQVEEVVVTAQKTSQNVQNVPIAVTAVTAQALQAKGIHDVASLSNIAPNVSLDAGTPFSGSDAVLAAYIQGIGQNDFAFNQDPGVGVYVDGVYLARSVGANTSMLDVARVEVLKGPQGTLFGRNSIGGAISIVTRDPSSEYGFRGEVTAGSFARLDVRGTADLPISDKLRTSISFSEVHRDGWQRRIPFPNPVSGSSGIPDCDALAAGTSCPFVVDGCQTQPAAGYQTGGKQGGQNSWSLRGKAVFDASDKLKFTLAGDYLNVDQQATANSVLSIDTSSTSQLGNLYNTCIGLPSGVLTAIGLGTLCNSPRLNVSPVPTPVQALPPLGGVNADGNPNNNRLPYNSRFITPDPINTTYSTGNNFSKLTNWGVAGTIDWQIGHDMSLKSITAYRELHWVVGMDLDGAPSDILQTSFDLPQHQFSEELQLVGKAIDNRLDYVFGAYYFKEGGHLHDYVTFPGALLMIDGPNDLDTRAEALYAHLHFNVTDQIGLTAGGRYTWEHKTFEGHQTDDNGLAYKASGCFPPNAFIFSPTVDCQGVLGFPNPSEPYRYYPAGVFTQDFSNFSPTLGIEFHPTMDLMIYGSWSKGYKTGNWTTRLSNPHPTYDATLHFDPEHATSEEIGIKSELFERHLRLNLAGFHTDYTGIQLNSQIGISPTLVNAGNARIWGAEAEFDAIFGMGFSLSGSVGYADAAYTKLNNVGDNGFALTLTSCPERLAVPVLGVQNGACNLPKTPKWKFNIGPQYVAEVGSAGALQFNLDYTHTTSEYNDLGNTFLLKRPAIDFVNASVTFKAAKNNWELTLGGTNLTDERYIVTGQNQGGVAQIQGTYSDPREWYATVRLHY